MILPADYPARRQLLQKSLRAKDQILKGKKKTKKKKEKEKDDEVGFRRNMCAAARFLCQNLPKPSSAAILGISTACAAMIPLDMPFNYGKK